MRELNNCNFLHNEWIIVMVYVLLRILKLRQVTLMALTLRLHLFHCSFLHSPASGFKYWPPTQANIHPTPFSNVAQFCIDFYLPKPRSSFPNSSVIIGIKVGENRVLTIWLGNEIADHLFISVQKQLILSLILNEINKLPKISLVILDSSLQKKGWSSLPLPLCRRE